VVSRYVSINIYPNPVDDILNLKMTNQKKDNLKIELSDVQGRTLYSKTMLVSQNAIELNIDMKSYQPQVYVLQITNSNGEIISTEKIIKR
jgi:hypothetical protein